MKTLSKLVLSIIFISSFSNIVFAGKVPLDKMELALSKINYDELGILIWDQRPMVVDKSQKESFIGYTRAIVGIAYPQFIESGQDLSLLLQSKIKTAYSSQGVKTNTIVSSPFESENQISQKIINYLHDKVLLIKLNKLYIDGVVNIEYVVDIELQLLNSKNEIIFKKRIIDNIPMGAASKFKKTVPVTLKKIIETLLNANDVIDAINNSHSKQVVSDITNTNDFIICLSGTLPQLIPGI